MSLALLRCTSRQEAFTNRILKAVNPTQIPIVGRTPRLAGHVVCS
jgi:hypothetical protein